jgi:hypothetical protein
MYVFGAFCLLGMVLGMVMIPGELNETATDEEVAELELIEEENAVPELAAKKRLRSISWCMLLS